jgi:predicted PurR-regulated permease PerM
MNHSKSIAFGIVKAVGVLTAVALFLWLIYQIQTVLLYLILALIFTLIANPIVEFLKKRLKFSNILAVIFTLFLFFVFIITLVLMFVPLILSQSESLALVNTDTINSNLSELSNQVTQYLASKNIDSSNFLSFDALMSKINFNLFTNFFNSILATISSFGMGLASVFFICFFFLKDKVNFLAAAKSIIPDKHEAQILNSITKINNLLSRYFIGLIIQLLIIFLLYLIVLLVFGVQNALIIAFLCAILNIIPYIGPLIGSVFAAILTMISTINGDFQTEILPTTTYVLVGFFIVQLIDNNINQPLIFSNSVKSHPLEIFLVILTAGFLSGITGMIVAVPVYTILKVIGKEFLPNNKIIQLLTKNL